MIFYPLDVAIVVWVLAGTIIIKWRLKLLAHGNCSRRTVVITAIAFSLLPLIVLRSNIAEYSAVAIVSAGIAICWFAVLASQCLKFPP